MKDYSMKYQQFLNNEISDSEWKEYCENVLVQLMEENTSVLKRLKDE